MENEQITCTHEAIRKENYFLYGWQKRCPFCRHEVYKKHYENNKAEIAKKHAEYRAKYPEKKIESHRMSEAKRKRYHEMYISFLLLLQITRNLVARE